MAEAGDPGYEVHASALVQQALRRLQERASLQGKGKALASAYRRAIERLASDPLDFGEAVYDLPVLRMQIRTAVVLPLAIDFGVCEDHPVVIIKGVKLL